MTIKQPIHARHENGLTLIELMISMVIGIIMLVGSVTMFQQSRATHRINESVALLQEKARFAIDILEPDIRLASFWGLSNHAEVIDRRAGQPGELGPLAGDCATRWYIDLDNTINGINGTNVIGGINASKAPMAGCIADANYLAGTDVLVVRRASENTFTPVAGRVAIRTNRMSGTLFTGATIPAGYGIAPAAQTFSLVAHGYHVSPDSLRFGAGVPSLRRQTLVAGPAIADQEILSGVEDFQVQFGIDTNGDLDVNRYVNPNNPLLVPGDPAFDPDAQIVAVRIWVRIRTINPEQGHTDTNNYVYADHNFPAPNDNFRRIVVSKTVQLRNTKERV